MLGRMGKYNLEKILGHGSSGKVYLALDTFSQTHVALKVLDQELFRQEANARHFLSQFLNEASLVGKLSHPHIVAILDAAVQDDGGYVAMEYVPGGNLSAFTKARSLLEVEDVLEIGFKCCGALDYASRQGIVHRDIKPANIMVVQGTEVKVADFGAAFMRGATTTQIETIGSPAYMAPEQIVGGDLGEKSDMFSLGVVLYELLTGEKPFNDTTSHGLVDKIVNHPPRAPSEVRTTLLPELDAVILRALAKKAADRYPTWAEFALALAQLGHMSVFQKTIHDSDKFKYLRSMEMMGQFSDPEIWELVQASRWTRVPPHTAIIREDEPGTSMFFLASGEVKVTKQGRLLNVLRAGDCFGEMGYIRKGGIARQATVESMTELVLADFGNGASGRPVSDACEKNLIYALLNTLVERLMLADSRLTRVMT